MRARNCLFWTNAECVCRKLFHYCLSFFLFLSQGASKAKNSIALINVVISFGSEYFCFQIFFPNFCLKFGSKIFFRNIFQFFFQHWFFQNFFFKFFFQSFFSMPHRLQEWNGLFMYLCYEKYDMQQAVEIGLSSRGMCRVLVFGSYCSYHTRRENFNFFPLLDNILL